MDRKKTGKTPGGNARGGETRTVFHRVTDGYVCLMLSVFLLWPGTGGFQGIMGAKYTLFLVLCGGYVLVMLACALELALVGERKLTAPKVLLKNSSRVQRLVAVYVLLSWVSALVSAHFPRTVLGVSRWEGALTITVYGLCFLLVSCFGRVTRGMLAVFAGAVCLFDILCVVQLFGGNPFGLYPEGMNWFDAGVKYSGAYLGTMGNTDLVAAFFCLTVPVLWVALLRGTGRLRWLLALPLGLSLFVLMKMSVMAGLVGVFAGGIVCLPFVLKASGRTRLWVGVGVVLLLLAALAVLRAVDFSQELLHQLHEVLNGNWDATFGSGRIRIWRDVLDRVPQALWLGHGPDTMALGGIEPFTRFDPALGVNIVSQIDVAHNEYLNILYHQGVLALAAYGAALVCAFVKFVRRAGESAAAAGLGGAVLCYCVQAFFGISMCLSAPLFWLAWGLLEREGGKRD